MGCAIGGHDKAVPTLYLFIILGVPAGHELRGERLVPQILPNQLHMDAASCSVAFYDAPQVADPFG